jgi:hypothetical protein
LVRWLVGWFSWLVCWLVVSLFVCLLVGWLACCVHLVQVSLEGLIRLFQ